VLIKGSITAIPTHLKDEASVRQSRENSWKVLASHYQLTFVISNFEEEAEGYSSPTAYLLLAIGLDIFGIFTSGQ